MDDCRPRIIHQEMPKGDEVGAAWVSVVGEPARFAEDDAAALSGGEFAGHSGSHRR